MGKETDRIATTATEALKILWEEDFFSGWRKKGPIVERLDKKGNHFSDAELGMALIRASHLTRRGKRGNFEYIQKFPFAAKQTLPSPKKKGGRKMNKEKIISSLRQIEGLVAECLREIGEKNPRASARVKTSAVRAPAVKNTLPSRLIFLRDQDFFKQPQTALETHKKIQPEYPCEVDRVAMALLRLFKS